MEKIKIFHSADAHGDIEAIKIYSDHIKEQKPCIAFLTGDLIHRVYTKEQFDSHDKKVQEYVEKKKALVDVVAEEAKRIGPEKMNEIFPIALFKAIQSDELAEGSLILSPEENQEQKTYSTIDLYNMVKDPKQIPKKIWEEIMPYLNVRERFKEHLKEHITVAEQSMETQYKEIAKILEGTDCLVLPGNHDGKCLEEIMSERDIHKDYKIIKGIKIAGYGSAKGQPWWIPEVLLEDFQFIVKTQEGKIMYQIPEAVQFIMKQDPDIAVFHETAYTDEVIKSYIRHKGPDIILTGHVHELVRPEKQNIGTYLIMPGKLGIIPPLEGGLIELLGEPEFIKAPTAGFSQLRTFVELYLQKEGEDEKLSLQPEKIVYKHIKNGKIIPLIEFNYAEEGVFKESHVLDKEAYALIPMGM